MLFITWIASPTKEGCHWQVGAENCQTGQLANPAWYPQPTIATTDIQEAVVVGLATDIKSQWRHNWKSAQVVNSYLVCNPTIRQLGFNLSRQQWSLLNRFRTEQTLRCLQKEMATHRHWSVSLWWYPDDGPHCRILPLTKLNGGLSRLHCADEDAVSWLTGYGSWHACIWEEEEVTAEH